MTYCISSNYIQVPLGSSTSGFVSDRVHADFSSAYLQQTPTRPFRTTVIRIYQNTTSLGVTCAGSGGGVEDLKISNPS